MDQLTAPTWPVLVTVSVIVAAPAGFRFDLPGASNGPVLVAPTIQHGL